MAGWPLAGVGEGFCYYLRLGRKGAPGPWTPDLVVRCLVVFARFEIEEEERLFSGGGVEWGSSCELDRWAISSLRPTTGV